MRICIAGTVNDSIVDGPGFRYTVFTQGCMHDCAGCHNPQTHDPKGGKEADTDAMIAEMRDNPLLDGLTLSGGEPFLQPEASRVLAEGAHALGLNVWIYSGFTFEELMGMQDPAVRSLLEACDVLIDGRFDINNRTLELRFRGSKNQRLIDIGRSLQAGKAMEHPL
ncbi:anaerobic ribonucleoside-triphosphate reductase activating protein [Eubacteriales bacterium OttesenSCG-928-N13]|nr:anaerobic ribonucleoside-triphosphate reductase activating protein [Eubacteriales bacterium OttesenSCG-928-N13]